MEIYEYRQIGETIWRIGERMRGARFSPAGALCIYLIVGSRKAAVIDSGMGITCDLRKICERITDKPLACYVTHGHPDHAGGAALFDEVYMDPGDEIDLKWALPAEKRYGDLEHFAGENEELKRYCKEHMIKDASFSYHPLYDGDKAVLGDAELEVISVPGHTPGSLCFFNRKEGYICVGDAVSYHQMFGASSMTVETYRHSLMRLVHMLPKDVQILTGHRGEALTMDAPEKMIRACEEVLDGKTGEDIPHQPMFKEQKEEYKVRIMLSHSTSECSLVYNKAKIWCDQNVQEIR